MSLKEIFPRLFSISKKKEYRIQNIGAYINGVWIWSLEWRRELFVWEKQLLEELLSLLGSVCLSEDTLDAWEWSLESSKCFWTKSAYSFLVRKAAIAHGFSMEVLGAIKHLWKCKVPSNILAFSWQAFLDRIPTKCNLFHRGIIQVIAEQSSPLCGNYYKDTNHLFISCVTPRFSLF